MGKQPSNTDKASLKEKTIRKAGKKSERGNIFFTLFGAVTIVGLLGAGIMSTMRGPLSTMVEINRIEEAKAEMRVNVRLILTQPQEYDTDTLQEPIDPAICTIGVPGAGCIPASIGAKLSDPWGNPYAYCAWNLGPDHSANPGGTNRILAGHLNSNYYTIALISAGPDLKFESSCTGSPPTINEAGDDIIVPMTYEQALASSGGLWKLADDDPDKLETERSIEVGGGGRFGGMLDLTGPTSQLRLGAQSMILPTDAELPTCNGGNANLLRVNTSKTPNRLEICDGQWVSAASLWVADVSDNLTYGEGNVSVTNNRTFTVTGQSNLDGGTSTTDLTTSGTASIGSTLAVTGAATLSNTLGVTGATTLSSTLDVTGATDLGGTLDVTGATDLGSTLDVTGATGLGSTLDVTGATTLSNTLGVTGATTLSSTLGVTGVSTLTGGFTAGAASSVNGELTVNGNLDLNGSADISGTLDVVGNIVTQGTVFINGDKDLAPRTCGETERIYWDGNSWECQTNTPGGSGTGGALVLDDLDDVNTGGSNSYYDCLVYNSGSGTWVKDKCVPDDVRQIDSIEYYNRAGSPSGVRITLPGLYGGTQTITAETVGGGVGVNGSNIAILGGASVLTGGHVYIDGGVGTGSDGNVVLALNHGAVGVGTATVSGDLLMDIEGKVGAQSYCDSAGNNCFVASDIAAASIFEITGAAGSEFVRPVAANVPTATSSFVFGSSQMDNLAGTGDDSRMFFNKARGAFRAGIVDGTQWNNANVGNYSVAFGQNTRAGGNHSIAMGSGATANFGNAIAMGANATASSHSAIALGEGSTASGGRSFSAGNNSTASGDRAVALGRSAVASGDHSSALGYNATASGSHAVSIGNLNTANNTNTTAIGYSNTASGLFAMTFGDRTTASGNNSIALGQEVRATGINTFAIGLADQSNTNADRPQVSGMGSVGFFMDQADNYDLSMTDTLAVIGGQIMIDTDANAATGHGCIQFNDVIAKLEYSDDCATYTAISDAGLATAIFEVTGAAGSEVVRSVNANAPHATADFLFGSTQLANTGNADHYSRMFFDKSKAAFRAGYVDADQWNNVGNYSIALGQNTIASSSNSIAIGRDVSATRTHAIAMGDNATASGNYSVVIGYFGASSSGYASVAMGRNAQAGGHQAYALGYGGRATGNESAVLGGRDNYATGLRAVTIGGNNTRAEGDYSTAIGQGARAEGNYTMAINLKANTSGTQRVTGEGSLGIFMKREENYNITQNDTFALIGGQIMIDTDGLSATGRGCIRYNDTDSKLEYSDNCTTYTAISDVAAASAVFEVTGAAGSEVVRQVAANAPLATSSFVFGSTSMNNVAGTDDDKRMFFNKAKGAFRAGGAEADQWDNANVGLYSIAMGRNARANNNDGVALGKNSSAGYEASAMGVSANASGLYSSAIGRGPTASGSSSVAIGYNAVARGESSIAIGRIVDSSGENGVAMGFRAFVGSGTAGDGTGHSSFAIGLQTQYQVPRVTGNRSMVLFFDKNVSNANHGYNFTANDKFAIIGGEFQIGETQAEGAAKGCIRFNATTDILEFSHNCSTYATFASAANSVFEVTGAAGSEVVRQVAANAPLATSSFVFGSTQMDGTVNADHHNRMFFNKAKGAFRAGRAQGTEWNNANVGDYSTAFGALNTASGNFSTALGSNNIASGAFSTTFGLFSHANASSAIAVGLQTSPHATLPQVSGQRSMVLFFDGGTANANSTYNFNLTDKFALIGGELVIGETQAQGAARGCIRFNDTTDQLEFSDDCATYSTFASLAGTDLWKNDGPTGPADIYYNGGNVAVGTNTLSSNIKFQVAGRAVITEGVMPTSGNYSWGFGYHNGGPSIYGGAYMNGTNRYITLRGSAGVKLHVRNTANEDFATFDGDARRLGINTTSPAESLHVVGRTIWQHGAPGGAINVGADANTTTRSANVRKLASFGMPDYANTRTIEFLSGDSDTASNNLVSIGGRVGGSAHAATQIRFVTAPDVSTAGGTSRMLINNLGNVGIGTDNPDARLDVQTPNNSTIGLKVTGPSSSTLAALAIHSSSIPVSMTRSGVGAWEWVIGANGGSGSTGNALIYRPRVENGGADGVVAIQNAGLNSVRWFVQTATGDQYNMGKLHLGNGTADFTQARALIDSSTPGLRGLIVRGYAGQTANLQEWRNSANDVLATVTAAGNVGIGTNAPGAKLTIDNTGSDYMRVTNTAGGVAGGIMKINSLGAVTFGEGAGWGSYAGSTFSRNVDISNGMSKGTLVLGADQDLTTRTDNTNKIFRIAGAPYIATQDPAAILVGVTTSTENRMFWGGGTAVMRGATVHGFYTAPTAADVGIERMRITAAGNVGIGTTAPVAKQHIYTPNLTDWGLTIEQGSSFPSHMTFQNGKLGLWSPTGVTPRDRGFTIGSEANGQLLTIYGNVTGDLTTPSIGSAGSAIMALGHTGNVGIGTTSPASRLHVVGDIRMTGVLIDVSDERLKTDIRPLQTLSQDTVLARLDQVSGYAFKMKEGNGTTEYGIMAQEIERVFPELVFTADDEMGTKSVNYTGLIAPLIEATKELKAENEEKEARLLALEARMAELENTVKGVQNHTGYQTSKGTWTDLALLLTLIAAGMGGAYVLRQRKRHG